jgi:hypothetical protein
MWSMASFTPPSLPRADPVPILQFFATFFRLSAKKPTF